MRRPKPNPPRVGGMDRNEISNDGNNMQYQILEYQLTEVTDVLKQDTTASNYSQMEGMLCAVLHVLYTYSFKYLK